MIIYLNIHNVLLNLKVMIENVKLLTDCNIPTKNTFVVLRIVVIFVVLKTVMKGRGDAAALMQLTNVVMCQLIMRHVLSVIISAIIFKSKKVSYKIHFKSYNIFHFLNLIFLFIEILCISYT